MTTHVNVASRHAATSLSSDVDEDGNANGGRCLTKGTDTAVGTMTGFGMDDIALQARSLESIPSSPRRDVVAVATTSIDGSDSRRRRRRATAPAESAVNRQATAGALAANDGAKDFRHRHVETDRTTCNMSSESDCSLLLQNPIGDDDVEMTSTNLAALLPEATGTTAAAANDSQVILANGSSVIRPTVELINPTPPGTFNFSALTGSTAPSGKLSGRKPTSVVRRRSVNSGKVPQSGSIGLSAPTLHHGRHMSGHGTGSSSGRSLATSKIDGISVSTAAGLISAAASVCSVLTAEVASSSASRAGVAGRPVGTVNPAPTALRRWSNQQIVDDLIGSAVSIYATPREQLSPERATDIEACLAPGNHSQSTSELPPDRVYTGDRPAAAGIAIGAAMSAGSGVIPGTSGCASRRLSMNTCGQYVREQLMSFSQPSDNRLAMKLFGNKNAFVRDRIRRSQAAAAAASSASERAPGEPGAPHTVKTSWIIHPCSNFRLYWDLFMLILLMANMITLPIAISFFNDDLSTHWIIFNGVCDTVFLTDLIINFRTGIIADKFVDDIIMEPIAIAKHYLKTWFLVDFVSSIPLDYIIVAMSPDTSATQMMHAGRALRMFRLIKLLSLLRLLRFSRLVRYINQWQEFLAVAGKFMRIFNLVCLILLMAHWNGCLQWLVPMLQDFPPDSWPALENLQQADWSEQYTWALFKALSHMLCIGFGRYPPQSTTDVWLTIVSMLTGATCYALFVGHSTTVIQSFDTSKRLYREKFKQVEEYMMYRKLPRKLRNNITDYYEHRYRGKMFDEMSILNEVNECLKEEIVNFNCRSLVAAVPFFTHADHNFVSDVVTKLQYEVFLPGDIIIRYGTVGTKMYFIQEGIVDILSQDLRVVTSLSDGSYFGEICLLTNSRRVASVRAETYCNLFSLSVEHFRSVLERYPDVRRTLESVALERLNITTKHSLTSPSRSRHAHVLDDTMQGGIDEPT